MISRESDKHPEPQGRGWLSMPGGPCNKGLERGKALPFPFFAAVLSLGCSSLATVVKSRESARALARPVHKDVQDVVVFFSSSPLPATGPVENGSRVPGDTSHPAGGQKGTALPRRAHGGGVSQCAWLVVSVGGCLEVWLGMCVCV